MDENASTAEKVAYIIATTVIWVCMIIGVVTITINIFA